MNNTEAAVTAVFIEAGWAPHFGIGGYARQSGSGWLVGGAPDPAQPMRSHLKITAKAPDAPDTPDDPVEAARVLVRLHGRGVVEVSVAPAREAEDSFAHETVDAQAGAEVEAEATRDASRDDEQSAGEVSARGLPEVAGVVGDSTPSLGAEILDADYDEAALGLPAPELEDFAPDPIKHPEPPGAGAFIFGDSLDHDRLIRQGQIWNHADMLIDALKAQTGWNQAEFNAVQSHIVTHLDGAGSYVGGNSDLYSRFVTLSDVQAKLRYIEMHRDDQISFIRQANHQQVSEFDPTEGWP